MDMIYQFQTTAPDAQTAVDQAHQAMDEMLKAYPDAVIADHPLLEVLEETDLVSKTFRFTQKFKLP